MDYLDLITKTRSSYDEQVLAFSKEDLKFITGKNTFKGKLLGFMKSSYYRREKLVKLGQISYAYVIRTYVESFDENKPTATWLLYSPMSEFDSNPELYKEISDKLFEFVSDKNNKKINHKLYVMLTENYAEPEYFELPSDFTNGKLVYLNFAYLRNFHNPFLHLGINLVIANKSVSKEILYLPLNYWCKEYKDYYVEEKDKGEKTQ